MSEACSSLVTKNGNSSRVRGIINRPYVSRVRCRTNEKFFGKETTKTTRMRICVCFAKDKTTEKPGEDSDITELFWPDKIQIRVEVLVRYNARVNNISLNRETKNKDSVKDKRSNPSRKVWERALEILGSRNALSIEYSSSYE